MTTVQPWVTRADLPSGLPTLPGGDDDLDAVCELASGVLYALSGRRWAGVVTGKTVAVFASQTPWWWSRADLGYGYDSSWGVCGVGTPALPLMVGGELYNHSGCDRPASIRLPDYPVRQVSQVSIGGVVRDHTTYRLVGNRFLEDMTLTGWQLCGWGSDEEVMTVTYDFGAAPPAPGVSSALRLASELVKAFANQPSALPGYLMQRERQGIREMYVRADTLFDKGKTGLPEVDLWLSAVNPGRLARRSRVWTPDTDPRYNTTVGGTTP